MAVGQVSFHNDKRVCRTVFVEWLIATKLRPSRSSAVRTSFLYAGGGTGVPHTFHRVVHVPNRENAIVNRLNKTKVERVVDHEAEQIERVKRENAVKRAAAAAKVNATQRPNPSSPDAIPQKKADLELAEARKAEKAARSYDSFLNAEVDDEEEAGKPSYSSVREMEEDFM